MSEDRDHLIEIGDPEDDTFVPATPPDPHVVIEYRDRGLPWMLVLPLLVTAAAVAIIGFKAFDNRTRPSPAPPEVTVTEDPRPPLRIIPDEDARDLGGMPLPPPSPVAMPLASIPPPSDVPPGPPAAIPPEAPNIAPPAVAEVVASAPEGIAAGPAPAPAPVPEPQALPRATEFGFDLQALERAEVKPDGPDGVMPAANPDVARGPGGPITPDQPRAVDPNDLPRDPRDAQRERVRRIIEARKLLDTERARFHADLRAVTKRFGARAGPQIADLCRRYGSEPDPVAKVQASRLLNVAAAGADRAVRINLLRSVGFPEASILLDIAETQGRWEDGTSRNGPRSRDDILRKAATFLLGCPPKSATPAARTSGPAGIAGRR